MSMVCFANGYSSLSLWLAIPLYVYHMPMRPDAYIVHASGAGQLLANPLVAGPRLSPWKATKMAVTTMGLMC